MFRNIILATALFGLATAPAMAVPSKGDWEIVFSHAGGGLETGGDATTLFAGVRAGYFLDATHEVGFGTDFSYTDTDEGSAESLSLVGFYRYNIASDNPDEWMYGGASLELLNVTNSDFSSELIRPHVGKKWMLSEDVAFDINGGILIPTDSDADTAFDVRFGLSIFY